MATNSIHDVPVVIPKWCTLQLTVIERQKLLCDEKQYFIENQEGTQLCEIWQPVKGMGWAIRFDWPTNFKKQITAQEAVDKAVSHLMEIAEPSQVMEYLPKNEKWYHCTENRHGNTNQ